MWLLDTSTRAAMQAADRCAAAPSPGEEMRYNALFGDDAGPESSRLLTIAGSTAQIEVSGVLTDKPSIMAMIFGGGNTTYRGIAQALSEADANPAVNNAVLRVNSPGGSFGGLFDALGAIEMFSKPLSASVGTMAASAAYAIVAKCDSIIVDNVASQVGSVGVVATLYVDDNEVSITSTNAPKKRPDVKTTEGVAMVREEIDAMHDIFVDTIAAGRRTSVKNVNTNFGQGATMLAEQALERGMIDAIASKQVAKATNTNPETNSMNLAEFKAQHPAVYAEAFALGEQAGVDGERDRVSQHLIMAEASGDMKTAISAIKDGSQMTGVMLATHQAAALGRRDRDNLTADEIAAAAAADNADTSATIDTSDAVADLVAQKLGYEG